MKTFFANNWRPHSGFLGQPAAAPAGTPAGNAIAQSTSPPVAFFAPPTSYIYPPYGYVYPPGYQGAYEVNVPAPAAPAPASSGALPYVIGGAVLLGIAALIARG